jgi:uncharacterized RDD family membrane protein YckC
VVQPAGVVTPEAVVLDFRTASVASRMLAAVIDLAVQLGTLVLLNAGLVGLLGDAGIGWVGVVFLVVVYFLVLFGYPIAMETLWRGRTLGKAALGLRVVTVEGAPVRFRHAAIRAALMLIDWYLPPVGVTATISVLLSRRDQRLGDLAAGTLVVRDRLAAVPPTAVTFPVPPGYEAYTGSLDAGALSGEQYRLVRSFLLRRHAMTPEARGRLAATIATGVSDALRHTPPPMVGAELFLACVAAAYQQRAAPASTRAPAPSVLWSPPGEERAPSDHRTDEGGFAPPA